jgi:tripartite-type tricarboxylate transporter receptor subunit TctC
VRFGWLGICASSGTPQPVVSLLNRHIVAVVQSAEYRAMADKAGTIAASSTPEELAKILADTYEETARTSREFGLQL